MQRFSGGASYRLSRQGEAHRVPDLGADLAAVLIFQTIVLNWTEEDALDWAYPVVQIAIFGVGLAAVWLAQVVRKLGIVAANLLDELLGVLAADEHLERITEREVDTFHRFLHPDVIVHAPLGLSTPGLMLKVGYPEHSADGK